MQLFINQFWWAVIPLSAISGGILIILTFIFYQKISNLKLQLKLLTDHRNELQQHNSYLEQEKITFIQKIEQLTGKNEYLNQLLNETDKIRKDSLELAKAALFELGGELSKQLIEIHKQENQEARTLSEKHIAATGEKFNKEFERLINMIGALNSDINQSKEAVDIIRQSLLSPVAAGKLAEITLENILKSSGLRSNIDFIMQYTLTTGEHLKLRPDALIFLPGNNLMVIDAKASKFLLNNMEAENLSKTMNLHLKSLCSKEYGENILGNFQNKDACYSNIITLMFLPTEHAIEKIIEANSNFMQKAWAANIFPVGPAGLMNMLSFAKFQISEYTRAENHKFIIEEVRKLLLSVNSMAEYSQKLGNNIQNMVSNYDKFAASFNRNFLTRVKNMQKFGIDTGNKNILPTLDRYQLVASKPEIIEASPITEENWQLEELSKDEVN